MWLDTIRIAREMGDVSALFPRGIESLFDLPHPIFDAIRLGVGFTKFDELPTKEQPPKKIWSDGPQLSAWFDEVRRQREEDTPGGDSGQNEPMQRNEAARGLIVE